MVMIRDTIDPTRQRDVSAVEALDLQRQGLLLSGTRAVTDEGLRAAAVRQVQRRQADAVPDAGAADTVDDNDDDNDDAAGPGDDDRDSLDIDTTQES